ncbi:MAG: alpha/beta hydrolase [Myxococcota bacterium]
MSAARSGGLAHALWTLAKPSPFDAVTPAVEGLAYGPTRKGIPPLCDIYLPRSGTNHPSVILVHGGGFVIGSRQMKPVRYLASRLCREGYAVCTVDYRLLFRGGGINEQSGDVDVAATFWRGRCASYGCDPNRISMAGFSAGATLTLLHAATTSHTYHRLVSFYGATAFHEVSGRRAELLLRLFFGTADRRVWRERSPLTLSQPDVPLLLLHGAADQMVPVRHSIELHRFREAAGLPSELHVFEGMRHGWLNDASLPETEDAVQRLLAFLR